MCAFFLCVKDIIYKTMRGMVRFKISVSGAL